MKWKDILKAELPPKNQEGAPITNEYRMAQDAWAKQYTNELLQGLGSLDADDSSSWCKIDPMAKQITWTLTSGSKTFSFDQFANELKSLLRASVYGQFKKTNYAFTEKMYLDDANSYVRDMVRNSTASNAFTNWMNR